MSIRIYHNPRCSKSRETLAGLEASGVAFEVVPYLEAPPDEAALRALVAALDVPAAQLVRTGDAAFVDSGLPADALDDEAVIAFLLAHPQAMQRPVVLRDGVARLGRPPAHALALVEDGA